MDSEATMEVAALGRPFGLGMLYDCRRDQLVPGITLWDSDMLDSLTRKRPQPYSDFEIVASESIEDKSLSLNVNASLKASFLGGLVEVGGSAKYLNDQKTSRNQARVTLTYKTTTEFHELSMDHLGRGNIKHQYVFNKGIATHVVTGILYGAQAFFIFDREVSQQENLQDIQGNMEVMIKKIPCLSIEGEGSLKMEDKDKANVDKFSCKFYGDFLLDNNSVTFQDAVEVYKRLPKKAQENAVPVKVWLLPLTVLDSSAAKLVREISIGLVQKAQNVLEDFSDLEMRYNDLMKTHTVQQFPQINKKIKEFKERSSEYKLKFQQTLAKKLPSIRGGGEEEAELAEILRKRHSSPFNNKDLHEWVDCKEREIYILQSFTSTMKNTKIIPTETHVYKESVDVEHTMCFVFTSLGSAEPYLSALFSYLRGTTTPYNPRDPHNYDVKKEQWYSSKEVAGEMRKQAKLFSDFAEANKDNKNTMFLVVGSTDETQRGSAIYLYKDGFSVSENFEPPSKPEAVTVSDIHHSSVTLQISPPRYGAENITSYLVEFCVCGEDEWKQQTVPIADVTVMDLSPNTEYKFRCRAVTSPGVGPATEVCSPIKTSPANSLSATEDSASTKRTSNSIDASIKTPSKSLGEIIKDDSKRIRSGNPSVYEVNLSKTKMNIQGCRGFTFGEESRKYNRTIMLLGATGSGKSTLINGMINYIFGVEWEDDFRFRIIKEVEKGSKAQSQTDEVTVYKLHHQEGFKVPYSLTIVDTPGFGDTRGVERDMQITEQIRTLFSANGVQEIDAVCVVAQAALARLTHTQTYVFDSVLSILGSDLAENIRLLVTFADGQQPPVLEAFSASGVPCPKTDKGLPVHFMFNNSALFADNTGTDSTWRFDQMFWEMGAQSMESFFDALNVMDTKSLSLTKEVHRERKQLENLVENLQKLVKIKITKLSEIKDTTELIKMNEAEINRNKDFEFEVTTTKPVKIEVTGENFLFNCNQCYYTCHDKFPYANDKDKIKCSAIGKDGYCTVCPSKCIWSVHFNQKFKWEYETVKEKRTIDVLIQKYLTATEKKKSFDALIKKLQAEHDVVEKEVGEIIECSTKSLNRLKEIALKPDPLSTPEYIDMLVEAEKREAQPGWKERVKSFLNIREHAEYVVKLMKREKL